MRFYTNVTKARNGKQLLVRGYENGKPFAHKVDYEPYLFLPSKTPSKYHTLDGRPVVRRDFSDMNEAKNFIKTYDGVEGFEIYGMDKFEYVYIYDDFYGEIKYDPSVVSVGSIDIEVAKSEDGGFATVEKADGEITSITLSKNKKKYVFSYKDYDPKPGVKYFKFADERKLLLGFLEIWISLELDILTGWNIDYFDVPYIINRIAKVLGEEAVKRLSPWGVINTREVFVRGKTQTIYTIVGISILDYLQLYQKFMYTNPENYKLDTIGELELNIKKIDYSEFGSLDELYEKDFQKFIDYNIRDVEIVDGLDEKLKLIELVMALAYNAKVNYLDTLGTVRPWDSLIHNFLMDRNTVIHQFKESTNYNTIVGGHVKEPKPGLYKWVASFDLNSLYPHLIQQFNISPDTFVKKLDRRMSVEEILAGSLKEYSEFMAENDVTVAANMTCYSRQKQGFLSEIMEKIYNDRVVFKNQMIAAKKEVENPSPSSNVAQLKNDIARYNNMQMAMKIFLNSGYGALANRYFRWFDNNYAEAITMSGQLAIQWIEREINGYLNKALNTKNIDFIIAADTDSVYLNLELLVKHQYPTGGDTTEIINWLDKFCSKVLEPVIERGYQKLCDYVNGFSQKMKMKRESLADKGIWTAKKRYVLNVYNNEGVAYATPQLKVTGIEAVKSSTPIGCQHAIKDVLRLMMAGDELEFHRYISEFRAKFRSLPFKEMASPRSVNGLKSFASATTIYKSATPINVKGALYYNHYLKHLDLEDKYEQIYDGDKIKYSYLRTPNPFNGATVIACPDDLPVEFKLQPYLDYDKQFEKAFLGPVRIIAEAIGWNTEKRSTIEDFFS